MMDGRATIAANGDGLRGIRVPAIVPPMPANTKKTTTKKATSKKAPAKKSTAKKAAGKPADALDPSLEWSLEEVEKHLPAVSDGEYQRVRSSLLRATSNEALSVLGTSFRTEDIFASAAPFAVGGLLALRKLGQPPPGLPRALFPLLVHEAQELGRMNASFEQEQRDVSAGISGRRAKLKRANSQALRGRRSVMQTLLRYVLPVDSPKRAELEAAGAGVDNHAGTVASVRTVARVLADLRKDEALRPVLDDYAYTDATVEWLLGLASDVEQLSAQGAGLRPPLATNQAMLDRQDGLVLTIMRAIWDPLRDARADGASIELPPTGSIDRFFNASTSNDDEKVVAAAPVTPSTDEQPAA